MNQKALEKKINSLKSYPIINPDTADRFIKIIEGLTDWELFRINPIKFAQDHGFDKREILDIFIHSAKIGLFDFEWNMLCPLCGGIAHSFDTIADLKEDSFHCVICDKEVVTDLNDFIEVAFNIDPGVHTLAIDPFKDYANYSRYFFSANYNTPEEFMKFFIERAFHSFHPIEPGQAVKIKFRGEKEQLYRLVCPDNNSILRIQLNDKISDVPEIIDIDMLPENFSPDRVDIPAGDIILNIQNRLPVITGVTLYLTDTEYVADIFKRNPRVFSPFITGKNLLNNQSFRDLFRIQALPKDLKLKVSNVTILFTDLKSSTELYEKIGDMSAYNLVQDHFDILMDSTRNHSGAIIKTIGDAVMASFTSPVESLLAALDMMNRIKKMNEFDRGHEVAIKVGLHTGTAIAVNANETLDYFGQTVNLAARVQGLAEGGEIWITAPIYNIDEIKNILDSNGYRAQEHSAVLKGLSMATTVYRCSRIN